MDKRKIDSAKRAIAQIAIKNHTSVDEVRLQMKVAMINGLVRYICVGVLFYDTDLSKYTFKELYSIAMLQDSLADLYPHWNSRFIGPFLASIQSSFDDSNPDMKEQIKGFTNSVRFGDILELNEGETKKDILARCRRWNNKYVFPQFPDYGLR